ncbi:hypothetical protein BBP40_002114 [Aspergillus hancockii]|nr:hypothetical protein BBP40_002114 [Aspergillus hancockii]
MLSLGEQVAHFDMIIESKGKKTFVLALNISLQPSDVEGNIGQNIIHRLVNRGHKVRATGRSATKMLAATKAFLESFVECPVFYDTPTPVRACQGADAAICTYGRIPRLQLDGQLLLLHAAERAGMKRFVATSCNYDWRDLELGKHESYNPFVSFRNQMQLTSDIKPIYVYTGIFAEALFCMSGAGHFDLEPLSRM